MSISELYPAGEHSKCSGTCDMQTYLRCQNGLGCACSAAKRAGPYDDVQQTIQTLTKRIQDLRERKDVEDTQRLINLSERVLALEASINETIKGEAEQRPKQSKPRTILDDFVNATRKTENSHVARQLDKLCEISTFVGVAQGSYFGDPEEFECLRQLMNGQ